MSLLFNMLSRFVIAFLLRNKHLLISWLQSLLLSLCGEQVGTFNTVTQGPRLKMVYFFVMLVISKYGFQGLHRGVQRLDALEFCLEIIHNTSDHGKIQSCGSHWTSREAGECEVAHEVLADQYCLPECKQLQVASPWTLHRRPGRSLQAWHKSYQNSLAEVSWIESWSLRTLAF